MSPSFSTLRVRQVRRVLGTVLVLNVAVAAAKLTVGWLVGSISMVADGFHSVTDGASNVLGLLGIRVASQPPDAEHPYGHRKFETLSALGIGALLALAAFEVLESCVERLLTGGAPRATAASFAVMGTTIVVNLAVTTYERRRSRQLGSPVLMADAAHTASDVWVSLAVVASLAATRLGFPQLDLAAALAITFVIGHAAFQILKENVDHLADTAHVPPGEVVRLAGEVPGVLSVHKVRTRGGPGGGWADLHVQVRADLRLDQAHVLGHRVADRLKAALDLADVVVHVEPPEGHRCDWEPSDADDLDVAPPSPS